MFITGHSFFCSLFSFLFFFFLLFFFFFFLFSFSFPIFLFSFSFQFYGFLHFFSLSFSLSLVLCLLLPFFSPFHSFFLSDSKATRRQRKRRGKSFLFVKIDDLFWMHYISVAVFYASRCPIYRVWRELGRWKSFQYASGENISWSIGRKTWDFWCPTVNIRGTVAKGLDFAKLWV